MTECSHRRAAKKSRRSARRPGHVDAASVRRASGAIVSFGAAILMLAAIVFFGRESVTVSGGQVVKFTADSDWIRVAHLTLAPLLFISDKTLSTLIPSCCTSSSL